MDTANQLNEMKWLDQKSKNMFAQEEKQQEAKQHKQQKLFKQRQKEEQNRIKHSRQAMLENGKDKKSKRRKEIELARLEAAHDMEKLKNVKITYDQVWDEDHTPGNWITEENLSAAQQANTLPKKVPKYKRKRNSVLLYGNGDIEKKASRYANAGAGRLLLSFRQMATRHLRKDFKEAQKKELKVVRAERKEAKKKLEASKTEKQQKTHQEHKRYMFGGEKSVRKAHRPTKIKESKEEVSQEQPQIAQSKSGRKSTRVRTKSGKKSKIDVSKVSISKISGGGDAAPAGARSKRVPPPPPPKPKLWTTPARKREIDALPPVVMRGTAGSRVRALSAGSKDLAVAETDIQAAWEKKGKKGRRKNSPPPLAKTT
jgi:hypothetical protein